MKAPPDPLPDWLTHLLDAPAERSFTATPGDRNRDAAPPAPHRAGDPLDGVILRGLVVTASGLVWAGILWLTLRHLLR